MVLIILGIWCPKVVVPKVRDTKIYSTNHFSKSQKIIHSKLFVSSHLLLFLLFPSLNIAQTVVHSATHIIWFTANLLTPAINKIGIKMLSQEISKNNKNPIFYFNSIYIFSFRYYICVSAKIEISSFFLT
jgi:hypothetical protein